MHTGSYGLMSADGSAQAAGPGGQEGHTATWPVWSGPVPPLAEGFAVRTDTVPGLAFTALRLVFRSAARWGLPCCPGSRCVRAVVTTPVELLGACRSLPQQCQLSLYKRQVSFHIAHFEACSTFTRVTARTLAESLNDPFHRRLQPGRYLPDCSDCYRPERPLPEGTCTLSRTVPFHGTRLPDARDRNL